MTDPGDFGGQEGRGSGNRGLRKDESRRATIRERLAASLGRWREAAEALEVEAGPGDKDQARVSRIRNRAGRHEDRGKASSPRVARLDRGRGFERSPSGPDRSNENGLPAEPYLSTLSQLFHARRSAPEALILAFRRTCSEVGRRHRRGLVVGTLTPRSIRIASDGIVTVDERVEGELDDLRYAAPEVAEQGARTPRSDVWTLGSILLEMLTGSPPPQPSDSLPESLPPAYRDLITRSLDHDPARRFADADDLLDALEAIS